MVNTSVTVELSRKLSPLPPRGLQFEKTVIMTTSTNSPAPLVLSDVGKETQTKVWDQLSKKLDKIRPGIMDAVS